MVTEDSPEDLPRGWTPHFEVLKSGRKVKYYMNSGTGQKFYSKADLMRYVKAQNLQLDEAQPTESPVERPSNDNQMNLVEYTNERPEWLPHGWIMELKTRKSGRSKCYVDPSTGSKFYSKPQVFRHLETVKQKSSTSEQKEMPVSIVPTSNLIQCTDEQPEWLPVGWIVEIKTIKSGPVRGRKHKVFIDPSTGCKFFSKPEVFRYLQNVKKKGSTSKQKEMPLSIVPTSNVTTEESTSEDLPPGWIKEIKIRKSKYRTHKDPFYTDPVSGYVFRSKRDVHRYLETGDIKACAILPRKRNFEDKSLVTTGKSTSQELPPGWIKEIKVTKSAYKNRKDPFYIDPVSGYVFRSKRDVHRYLEAGDISACAILPRKRDIKDKCLPSSATKRQKLEHPVTNHQLLGENRSSDVGSMASPRVYSLRKRGTETVTALTTLPVAITVDMSSQRSPRDEDTESKEYSSDNCSPQSKAEDLEKNEDGNASTRTRRDQKWLSLPRRCSNRLAGFEADMEINSLSIVQVRSEVDKKQGKNSGSGTEAVGSKTKTQNNLPLRSSKRLAGFEPDSVANSVIIVQSLPKIDRHPNDEATLAVGLNKGDMTQAEPSKELVVHTSSGANNSLIEEPSNESQGCEAKYMRRNRVKLVDADNLPISTPEAHMKQENRLESVNKQRSQVSDEDNLRASKKKKELNLPCRSSKRLASTEPEMKTNSMSVPDGLADEALSPKLIQDEHGLETPQPLHGEPPNKNQPFLDVHAGSEDKLQSVGKSDNKKLESELQTVEVSKSVGKKSESVLQTVEVSKSDDKKSELEFIPPLGEFLSDPCLEFAFKTLTGELPVEMASVSGPVSTSASDIIGERNSTPEKKGKRSIKGKAPISSKKSKTTEHSLPHEDLEFQPEPVVNQIIKGHANKNLARRPSITGAAPNGSPVAPEAQQVHNYNAGGDKPEQPPVFTFSDYWSNPSLESTFKTLTGSLPVEDNIQGKSYLQQQVESSSKGYLQQQSEISQTSKDVSATLPDYSFPHLFQTDTSAHFESPGRLSSQPQVPVKNNPFLSSGSLSFSSFSGIGGGFSSFRGNGFQQPPPTKKNQPSPLGGGFSSCKGIGFQPPPPIKKNQPSPLVKRPRGRPPLVKRPRGRPRKVTS